MSSAQPPRRPQHQAIERNHRGAASAAAAADDSTPCPFHDGQYQSLLGCGTGGGSSCEKRGRCRPLLHCSHHGAAPPPECETMSSAQPPRRPQHQAIERNDRGAASASASAAAAAAATDSTSYPFHDGQYQSLLGGGGTGGGERDGGGGGKGMDVVARSYGSAGGGVDGGSPPPSSTPSSPLRRARAKASTSATGPRYGDVGVDVITGGRRGGSDRPPSPWLRKPHWVASPRVDPNSGSGGDGGTGGGGGLRRHLTLFDLICVGVGATVGSGIFVLCGLIARDHAGPATFVSWAVAGLAACCSGLCYAELAGKYPTAGSTYCYAYVSMGELPAVVAGACLTLEYVFSASAVARSWGDKVVEYVRVTSSSSASSSSLPLRWSWLLDPGWGLNPMAFAVSAASVLLLLGGVRESKVVTNVTTVFKVGLVLFMSFGALRLMEVENLSPLVPPEFGVAGVLRGATSSFFGYIGFDEICCLSGEAKNPAVNLPRAVVASLVIVTALYMVAAVALVGMVPYGDISETSGFPDGFRYRGWDAAAQISAIGELVTLPIVVLVTIMAQPRLQYAMAVDGLLPPVFARVDGTGNPWHGTLISGACMVCVATFVPFAYLDDLVSAGILVAFSVTDASVVLLRRDSPRGRPGLLGGLLAAFHATSFASGLFLGHCHRGGGGGPLGGSIGPILAGISLLTLVALARTVATECPPRSSSSSSSSSLPPPRHHQLQRRSHPHRQFETPFVPYLPLLGTFVNWYLVAQLEWTGILLLVGYVSAAVAFYFAYGAGHSVGNATGWSHIAEYEIVGRATAASHGKADDHDGDVDRGGGGGGGGGPGRGDGRDDPPIMISPSRLPRRSTVGKEDGGYASE